MKKIVFSIFAVSLMLCCGAAENYSTVMKAGHAARNKRDCATAIAAYQKAGTLAKTPADKYYSAYYEQECLKSQRKYDEAIALMQKAVKIDKLSPELQADAFYNCGQLAWTKKDLKAAQQFLEQSAKVGKGWTSARSLSNLGDLMRRQRKYAESDKYYKEALKRDEPGTRQEAYFGLSLNCYDTRKDFNAAIAPVREAQKEAAKLNDVQKIRAIYYNVVILAAYKKTDDAVKEAWKVKSFKNPQKDWAAAAYCTAANAAFNQKKDVKSAKALMAEASKLNATWGFNKSLQKTLDAIK